MSSGGYGDSLYGEDLYTGGSTGDLTSIQLVDGTDLTPRFVELNDKFSIEFNTEGVKASLPFLYFDGETPPARGDRFVFRFPNGRRVLLHAHKTSKVTEYYGDLVTWIGGDSTNVLWFHTFDVVDPLTYLLTKKLPNWKPFLGTSTGAIFRALVAYYDSTLDTSGVANGNPVTALNLREFSTFGDLLRSEITAGGYILRMGDFNRVEGAFDTDLPVTDFAVDLTLETYTPSLQDIDPPDEYITSVTVVPNGQVPDHCVSEYIEEDGRVQATIPLLEKPFGLDKAEILKLAAGIDTSDEKTYEVSGTVTATGSHIELLGGSLTVLEARPYQFPFISVWTNIRALSGGASFEFGFVDADGNFLLRLSSDGFGGLIEDEPLHQHIYQVYATPTQGGEITLWGYHLDQNFMADIDAVIAQVDSVDGANSAITLTSPWTPGQDYIRVMQGSSEDDERGRVMITRRSEDGLTLTLSTIPGGTTAGDNVTRGSSDDQTLTMVSFGSVATGLGFGLPFMSGTDVAVEAMIVQRIGQVDGVLLSDNYVAVNRPMLLEVDLIENTDGQIANSGNGALISLHKKFSHNPRLEMVFSYVVGGSGEYSSQCGDGTGSHVTLQIDNEEDPAVLQAIANRLCYLGSLSYPRVQRDKLGSFQTTSVPVAGDMLPVVLPPEYRVTNGNLPINVLSVKWGGVDGNDTDVLIYHIDAGRKSAEERAREEFLRGRPITKYPIRIATLSGARISSVNWDNEILTASVNGTVYDSHGNALDLAGGVRPAEVAGVAHPAAAPVTFRGTVPQIGRKPDILTFRVVYPPDGVDATTLRTRIFPLVKQAEWIWDLPLGAEKQNILRQIAGHTGEGDSDLEIIATVVRPSSSWRGPVSKDNKTIWVQSIGLCDKTSSKIKLVANPARLAAPVIAFLKLEDDNDTKIITQPPPETATAIMFVTAPDNSGFNGTDGIPIPDPNTTVTITVLPLLTSGDQANHYTVPYNSTQAGRDFYLTAAWLNIFDEPQDWCVPINPNALATARPLTPPTPVIADLVLNEPNFETVESDANVEVLIHADENWQTKASGDWLTFDEDNARGVKAMLRPVKSQNREVHAVGSSSDWTNPLNARKSDNSYATCPGASGAMTAQLIVNGVLVGAPKAFTIAGQADVVYLAGAPGDFWGAPFATLDQTYLNTNGGVGVRLICNGLTQDYTFKTFDVTTGGTVHGFSVRMEASFRASIGVQVDLIIGTAYFSRSPDNLEPFKFGGGDFADDTLEFATSAKVATTVTFGKVYWLWKYMFKNGKLKTASAASAPDCVFIGGAVAGTLTPTIISVSEDTTGDVLQYRAIVRFTQIGPQAIPPDYLAIRRQKGSTDKFKRIGDQVPLFGLDEYLTPGVRDVEYTFPASEGVTDYNLIAVLFTAMGTSAQSAVYPFSTNSAPSAVVDAAVPQVPIVKNTRWRDGERSLVVFAQPVDDPAHVHEWELAFFYPGGSAPGARHFFNIDTGVEVSGSPTFGKTGSAGFFSQDGRFRGDVKRAELPSGALTAAGIGLIIRAYNTVLDPSGNPGIGVSTSDTNFATMTQLGVLSSIGLDSQVQDTAKPGPVQNLTGRWKKKVGYSFDWDKPATNINSLQDYWVVLHNGTDFMDHNTGLVASPNNENGARFQHNASKYEVGFQILEMATQFRANLQARVYATNIVAGNLTLSDPTESNVVSSTTDSAGEPIDAGAPPQPVLNLAQWLATAGLRFAWTISGSNIETVADYEYAMWYPAIATGLAGSRRFYFHPDTGGATGEYEHGVTATATFGRSGNSGFFTGGAKHNRPHLKRALLPAGALTGGVGFEVRAYNKIAHPTTPGLVIEGTSVTDAQFPELVSSATYQMPAAAFAADAFSEDTQPPGPVQNLQVFWRSGHKWVIDWNEPTGIKGKKGYWVVLFNGANFMNRLTGAAVNTGIATNDENTVKFFVEKSKFNVGLERAVMAAPFRDTLTAKVWAVNYVGSVETEALVINRVTASGAVGSDFAQDVTAPTGLATGTITFESGHLKYEFAQATGAISTITKNTICFHDGGAGAARRFWNPKTGVVVLAADSSGNPPATHEIEVGKGDHISFPKKKSVLTAIGVGGPSPGTAFVTLFAFHRSYNVNPTATAFAQSPTPDAQLTISSAAGDPVQPDTLSPNGGTAMTAPRVRIRGGATHISFDLQTGNGSGGAITQLNEFQYAQVIMHNGAAAGARRYFDLVNGVWSSNSTEIAQPIGRGGSTTYNFGYNSIFISGFPSAFVFYRLWNKINFTNSLDTSAQTAGTSGSDPVVLDTLAPNNSVDMPAPLTYFEPNNGIVIDFSLTGIGNINNIITTSVRVGNNAETSFLEIRTKAAIADGTASKKQINGTRTQMSITRRKLRSLFGDTAILKVRYFITNNIGETQSLANTLNLDNIEETMSDTGLEDGATIPLGTYNHGPVNLVPNGALLYSDDAVQVASGGSGDTDLLGFRWYSTPDQAGGVRLRASTASRGLKWRKSTHDIEMATNTFSQGGELSIRTNTRCFIPGQSYAFSVLFRATSNNDFANVNFSLYDEGNGAAIPGANLTVATNTIILTTSFLAIGGVFTISNSYVPGTSKRRQWFRIRPLADHTDTWFIDNICVVDKAQILLHFPSLEDAGIVVDVDVTSNTGAGGFGGGGGGGNFGATGTIIGGGGVGELKF